MKRRLTALVCALVLMLGILPARAITEADIYFVAVNIKLLPLAADTMPIWVGGEIYVPASVFDEATTDVDLGVLVERNRAQNTIALYTLRQMLVFDLDSGRCTDHANQTLDMRCVVRGGRPYLPLAAVCDVFGLRDTYAYTRHGYLIRICSEDTRLSNDADFVDAASEVMRSRAKEFLDSQKPAAPELPPPPPPSVMPDDPVVTPPEQDQPKGRVLVYLA